MKAGDVVMEFDPAEQQYALDQALSELAEAEQQVIRRRADIEARAAQDQVTCSTRATASAARNSTPHTPSG